VLVSRLKPVANKILFGIFGVCLILFLFELSWFFFVLQKDSEIVGADAVVVFGGSHARTVKGYELVNRGYAPFLVISPASEKQLERLDQTYRLKDSYQYLIEDRAETTFQNSVLAADLIKTHDLTSVALVTSDYHLPRSVFLLKFLLLGRGVAVRPYPVEVGRFKCNPLAWSSIQKKIVYNEMVEFWGSLVEMAHYFVTGQLPERGIKKSKTVSWLRLVLLFDVRRSWGAWY
jgi:uncharacterized SAM-binding protein YcdF (DUF218 family)